MRFLPLSCLLLLATSTFSQTLTVEKIMRDPKWIGSSPSGIYWSHDATKLYFQWRPDNAPADSLYMITPANRTPVKVPVTEKKMLSDQGNIVYNTNRNAITYSSNGDIFYTDLKSGKTKRIIQSTERESNPQFSFNDTRIVYTLNQSMYAWDINTGETQQLTATRSRAESTSQGPRPGTTPQEKWLKEDQLQYFEVLKSRKEKREATEAYNKSLPKEKELRAIDISDRSLGGLTISPDGRFISYRLFRNASNAKNTIVPNYVTETGFTTDIPGRTKVGAPLGVSEFFIYDRVRDTVLAIKGDSIGGIRDIPAFYNDYPSLLGEKQKKPANRSFFVSGISWAPNGMYAMLDVRATDNKDRWLLLWDTAKANSNLMLVDRQHDDAWVSGPGIGFGRWGWIDESNFWYQSEKTGYSHIYIVNINTGEKKQLTNGNYEVLQAQLSRDKKTFFITTNAVHPGEQHFYHLKLSDGKMDKITTMKGANQVTVSPDEKWIAVLHSYTNQPWELYLQENRVNGKISMITDKAQSEEFRQYAWRDPEVITFPAADGAMVYARIYKPANPHPSKPAVLFVHGAGYLQNAHKWWSSYFREYMFNNLLTDMGYYVMDIDYRGSAGYGRDWRTGIYRHMGGKDLSDHVDAAKYLVNQYGVDPKRIGIYGGSYGGFISLMGMFTTPGTFAAGAALRPVTDWAQYNHGYTSNILNEPFTDSIAYRRSSPLYFAEGLQGHLLMLHGMVDVNVHFQDVVKLSQRLIELGKDNWELAVYPVEDHGFVEPSSWTDEYKRILKLFETVLKKGY